MKNILTNDFASELFDLSEDSIYNILEEFNENQNIDKTITLAIIPTIIFFVCGITLKHWGLIISSIIFGFAHTLITYKNNC